MTQVTTSHRADRSNLPAKLPQARDVGFGHAWASTVLAGTLGFISFWLVFSIVVTAIAGVVTVVIPVLMAVLLALFLRWASAVHRDRLVQLLGVDLTLSTIPIRGSFMGRARTILTTRSTWRQLTYHSLVGLLDFVTMLIVCSVAGAGLALAVGSLLDGISVSALRGWGTGAVLLRIATVLVGLFLLAASFWLARLATLIDVGFAAMLLGPSQTDELNDRVEELAVSRAGVLDSAASERRRIERDLHDGTQQRLTSLAMNLGIAKSTLKDVPQPARQAIEDAHEEAKQALAELRMVVRGLHPAVLDDRGLDAALSGIVARCPIPVDLSVELPIRPSRTIESVAYFVVSEALTNIMKHSGASQVTISIDGDDRWMWIRIADNGIGGADLAAGTGLAGLQQRVNGADGSFLIDSPEGGPTVLIVELPCAS